MSTNIIDQSLSYATQIILEELSTDFIYHNLDHTLSVLSQCKLLGTHEGVSTEDQEILNIAAIFHDLGYRYAYIGHEAHSVKIAIKFLEEVNYPSEKLAVIVGCIEATVVDNQPNTLLEQIIKDADLAALAGEKFEDTSASLRYEWKAFCDELYTDKEWYQINFDFMEKHSYFTESAKKIYGEGKRANLARMVELLAEEG